MYMSAFFERNKREYMDLMLAVSIRGDWESWIEFCLNGVIAQAKDTERRCDKLMALHRDFHERIKSLRGGSVRLSGLVDNLFILPVAIVTVVVKQCHVTYATAKADLKKLESLGIVKQLAGSSPAAYYCNSIYAVTYGDEPQEDAP